MLFLISAIQLVTCVWLLFSASQTFAASDRESFDVDGDGLIELYDTEDIMALKSVYEKGQASLYGLSTGCPAEGCRGYELANDIDYSSTQQIGDLFFIDQVFEGNHHEISGLTSGANSLFYQMVGVEVRNLSLANIRIQAGIDYLGGIAEIAMNSVIINTHVSGQLTSRHYTGGLIGVAHNVSIVNSHFRGVIDPGRSDSSLGAGGLVGFADNVSIYGSSAQGQMQGRLADKVGPIGGLVGVSNGVTIIASYSDLTYTSDNISGGLVGEKSGPIIARDSFIITREQEENPRVNLVDYLRNTYLAPNNVSSIRKLTLTELSCSATASDSSCSTPNLNTEWTKYVDQDGTAIWDFTSSQGYPTIRSDLNFYSFADTDGDGIIDLADNYPNNRALSLDTDGDGVPDIIHSYCGDGCLTTIDATIDAFPNNKAAHADADGDGFPDTWANQCDEACQQSSGLTLDPYIDDTDNDGITNQDDQDDNGDGIIDWDTNNNGLIELYTIEDLRRMEGSYRLNNPGCPLVMYQGNRQHMCRGYELMNDLDFGNHADNTIKDDHLDPPDDAGFSPLPTFRHVLDGRGHTIYNLFIDRPEDDDVGFFKGIAGAHIYQLHFSGESTRVVGGSRVGGLASFVIDSELIDVSFNGHVESQAAEAIYLGGLLGSMSNSRIYAAQFDGYIRGAGDGQIGGITGLMENSMIAASTVSGEINTPSTVLAPFAGQAKNSTIQYSIGNVSSKTAITSYYFADQDSDIHYSYAASEKGGVGIGNKGQLFDIETLSCPTVSDDAHCQNNPYKLWTSFIEASGFYWDFGDRQQLPKIHVSRFDYQDLDGDAVWDIFDAFPTDYRVWQDRDSDGKSDAWNPMTCDQICQNSSELILDEHVAILDKRVTPTEKDSSTPSVSGGSVGMYFLWCLGLLIYPRLRGVGHIENC